MDNFTIIYKILKALEKAMDYEEFDINTMNDGKNLEYRSTLKWQEILSNIPVFIL